MIAEECSNIAVRNLPYSGIYIVGNIITSLEKYILANK